MSAPLPTEVTDNIIAHAIDSCDFDFALPLLSSIALVSRRYRQTVIAHRFAEVFMYRFGIPSPQVHQLVALVESDIWAEHEGIAPHITSVDVTIDAEAVATYGPYHDESVDLAVLFKRLFRSDKAPTLSWARRWIRIVAFNCEECDFTALGPVMMKALHDACCDSYVTDLELVNFHNVPKTLLNSGITRLDIHNTRFSPSGEAEFSLRNLRNISLDYSSASSSIGDLLQSPENFPVLDSLAYKLDDPSDFHKLSDLGRRIGSQLIKLEIFVDSGVFNVPPSAIDHTPFSALQALKIGRKALFDRFAENSALQTPLFLDIFCLLPDDIPPALTIEVTLGWDSFDLPPDTEFATVHRVIDQMYLRIYHSALMGLLEARSRSFTTHVIINLYLGNGYAVSQHPSLIYIRRLRDEARAYGRQLFSRLVWIPGLTLDVSAM